MRDEIKFKTQNEKKKKEKPKKQKHEKPKQKDENLVLPKEQIENADLYIRRLIKIMTTRE